MACKNWKKIVEDTGAKGKKIVYKNKKTGREIKLYHEVSRGGILGNLSKGDWEVVLTTKGIMNLAENKEILGSKSGAKKLANKWMRSHKED